MVFAVNPGDDFDAFKSAAMGRPVSSSTQISSTTSSTPVTSANSTIAVTMTSSIAVVTVTTTVTITQFPSTTSSQSPSATPTSANHRVVVGSPGLLSFQPSNIKASVGDTITFKFHQKNHTVTASSFDRPCESLSETSNGREVGFDSGL